jgi:hypothetical protein
MVERAEDEEEDVLCVMHLVSPVMKEGEQSVNNIRSRNNEAEVKGREMKEGASGEELSR